MTSRVPDRPVRPVNMAGLRLESGARESVDDAVVADYAAAMKAGHIFPPVLVYEDADALWLVDGLHRIKARQANGSTTILAEVRRGGLDDAVWESCSVNRSHGLRRSNADKRRSVHRALLLPKGQRLSDRQLASHCGVHHHTVGRIRAELVASGVLCQMSTRMALRGGIAYSLRTESVSDSNRRRAGATSGTPSRSVSDIHELGAGGGRPVDEIHSDTLQHRLMPLRAALPTPPSPGHLLDLASQYLGQALQCLHELHTRFAGAGGVDSSARFEPVQRQTTELQQTLTKLAKFAKRREVASGPT